MLSEERKERRGEERELLGRLCVMWSREIMELANESRTTFCLRVVDRGVSPSSSLLKLHVEKEEGESSMRWPNLAIMLN